MKTYKQQFDAITEAYIKGEIEPLDPHFCFCGTLCENTKTWFIDSGNKHNHSHGYTGREFVRMENALIDTISNTIVHWRRATPEYETALFNGMVAALEVLRQIHLEKGDETAQPITLQKRTLCAAQ